MEKNTVQEQEQDIDLAFWGTIKPIRSEVIWAGTPHSAHFRIPTMEEEMDIVATIKRVAKQMTDRLVAQNTEERMPDVESIQNALEIIAEGVLRMAYALVMVDNKEVAKRYPEVDDRIEWILDWPGTLFDAVVLSYRIAKSEPFRVLQEKMADPNLETAPFGNGTDSKDADLPLSREEASTLTNGPLSSSTPTTTNETSSLLKMP